MKQITFNVDLTLTVYEGHEDSDYEQEVLAYLEDVILNRPVNSDIIDGVTDIKIY